MAVNYLAEYQFGKVAKIVFNKASEKGKRRMTILDARRCIRPCMACTGLIFVFFFVHV